MTDIISIFIMPRSKQSYINYLKKKYLRHHPHVQNPAIFLGILI